MTSGFPRPVFELTDTTPTAAFVPSDVENLFAPFIPFFAEKGPVGQIQYSGDVKFGNVYGTQITTHGSDYYTLSNGILDRSLNGPNPVNCYGVRLVDPAAKLASVVLTCTPTPMAIPQYKVDSLGNRILDSAGKPQPKLGVDGRTAVTEPGIVLLWGVRQLEAGEVVGSAKTTVATVGKQQVTTYPIIAATGSSVGKLLNNTGMRFYRPASPATDVEGRIGAVLYRFVPMLLNSSLSTTAAVVGDVSGNQYNDVAFKPNAIDPLMSTNYSFNKVLFSSYYDQNANPLLDTNIAVYSANVKTIGDQCLAASPELAGIVADGWGIDLIGGTVDGTIPYRHIAIDPNSAKVVSSDVINYLAGGTDGDTSETMFRSLLIDYVNNAGSNGFRNIGRYQFTHMFDPGWPLAVKKQVIPLLGQRQLLKLVLSTQDVSMPPNTRMQDMAAAEAIMGVLALYPESMAANLGVSRADVCYQTGKLSSQDLSADPVPLVTYKRFDQLAQYHGKTYITGSPNGAPGSYINEFRPNTINWVPDDEDQMDAAWGNKAIYAMYAARNQLFIPGLRSVVTNETSLLSDSTFVDKILYRMKLCFGVWAQVSGSDVDHSELFPAVQDKIQKLFKQAFGTTNTDTVTLSETADDANNGTSVHAYITIFGDGNLRKITFSFILERNAAVSTASTSSS